MDPAPVAVRAPPRRSRRWSRRCRCSCAAAFRSLRRRSSSAAWPASRSPIPAAIADGTSFALFALMLAFWVAGRSASRRQAIAGAAIGLAAVVVIARERGPRWRRRDRGVRAAPLRSGRYRGRAVAGRARAAARARRTAELRSGRPARARARGARARGGRGGARPDRARPARRDRAQRQRHDRPGRSRAAAPRPASPRAPASRCSSSRRPGRQALAEMRRLLGSCATSRGRRGARTAARHGRSQPARRAGSGGPGCRSTSSSRASRGACARRRARGLPLVQEALTNARKHAGAARARVVTVQLPARRAGARDLRRRSATVEPRPGDGHGLHRHARARRPLRRRVRGRAPRRPAASACERPLVPTRTRASSMSATAVTDSDEIWSLLGGIRFDALVVLLAAVSRSRSGPPRPRAQGCRHPRPRALDAAAAPAAPVPVCRPRLRLRRADRPPRSPIRPRSAARSTGLPRFYLTFWVVGAHDDAKPGDRRRGDRLRRVWRSSPRADVRVDTGAGLRDGDRDAPSR